MQHKLIKTTPSDTVTLTGEMFSCFKKHLRVLNSHEDDTIQIYLKGAIDAIQTYASNDIFLARYKVFYPNTPDYSAPSDVDEWYCGKHTISDVVITDTNGVDVTADYAIDLEKGMFYPHPQNMNILFSAGYAHSDKMPPRLINIIERYGAELYEQREASRIGDLKNLPNWIPYSLASIWTPRV